MTQMTDAFVQIFPPKDRAEEMTIGEGVENCVTKNLYPELFGQNKMEG